MIKRIIFCSLFILLTAGQVSAKSYQTPEFKITIETKGFPGGKANLSTRLQVPPNMVWAAILDANKHADIYPRIARSFCISEANTAEAQEKGLRNGATVDRLYKKKKCKPPEMSQAGQVWEYNLFQEIDYPFPLSDRWMITKAENDETQSNKGIYKQKGSLIYGRQDIYEFALEARPHPKYPDQTYFTMFIWSDPGGFIPDWMVKKATEYIAPRFMEILEREAQKRAGMPLSSPED